VLQRNTATTLAVLSADVSLAAALRYCYQQRELLNPHATIREMCASKTRSTGLWLAASSQSFLWR